MHIRSRPKHVRPRTGSARPRARRRGRSSRGRSRAVSSLISSRLVVATCLVAGLLCSLLAAYGLGPVKGFIAPSSSPISAWTTGLSAGVSTGSITNLSDQSLTKTMQGITSADASWVRLEVDWPVAEGSEGSFDWAPSDRVIGNALSHGLQVDLLVNGSGPGNVPSWAQTKGYPDPSKFASFAAATVRHYGAMGIHTYEIWNEPNLATDWGPEVSPTGYTALLVQAYDAIKAVDPLDFVISGGLAPSVDAANGSTMSPRTFLADMYAAGAEGHMDAVGVHPYCFPADPSDPSSASWNFFYNLPDWIYQTMEAHGDGGKKVWMTEFGAPTGSATSDGAVSEQQQAQMVTDAFNQAEQWTWAGPLFVYDWQDGTDAASVYDNFGLVDASWNPKPALTAFEDAAQHLQATRGLGSLPGSSPAPSVGPSQRTSTGSTLATGPATAAAGGASGAAPTDESLPQIAGQAQVGQTLSASTGSWFEAPTSFSYQWERCVLLMCFTINSARAPTYTLDGSDTGYVMRVAVTASNGGGASPATSGPSEPVRAGR